jgi:tetratricopeptide (TPR) repeat protein
MLGRKAAQIITGGFFISAFFTSGCATTPLQSQRLLQTAPAFPQPIELREVPFFPQERYHCGPAALAMVLNWSEVPTTPEALAPQVYLPERRGSLQLEMLAAARQHGRIPYILRPELEAVFAEIASGHPVLVLQNLGLSWYPKWHYAVVVGFDLPRHQIVLRSGSIRRHVVSIELFERTWQRGNHWAMVVLPPDRLPHTAEEKRYLQEVAVLERLRRWDEAVTAYATALGRWPKSTIARLGLGNAYYAQGDLREAEQALQMALRDDPDSAVTLNNLAQVLIEQGRFLEAQRAARRAVELGGPWLDTYRETLQQVMARQRLMTEPLGPPAITSQ